jgi:type IV secretion system protein VirB3
MDPSLSTQAPAMTPLVKGLTRPPTLWGVPYMYFMLNGVIVSVVFLASKNLFSFLLAIPIHLIGTILILREPKIFEILLVRSMKCPPRSRAFWGATSYRV